MAHGIHGIHGKIGRGETERGAEFFNHERHETHEKRRAGTGVIARELCEGTRMAERGFGRGPTEYTDDTEWTAGSGWAEGGKLA